MKNRFIKKSLLGLALIFFVILFFKTCGSESKLYYIHQANIYIKLHRGFYNETVDVYFSSNKNGPFSEKDNYIKSTGKSPVNIIVNPNDSHKLILSFDNYAVLKVYSKDFNVKQFRNEMIDTTFYYSQIRTEPRILKSPYLCISISEYMNGICIKECGKKYLDKVDECR